MIDAVPIAATSTVVFIRILARLAPNLGLLDVPDHRKQHEGTVPLVGGLAIGLAYLMASTLVLPQPIARPVLDVGILLLLCVGAIDDRIALRPRWRLLAQGTVALGLITVGGLQITTFGDLFGFGEVTLSTTVGALFTLFFIVSLINGFNMLDGLDGLAGGVGAIMLVGLCIAAASVGAIIPLAHMIVFLAGLLGFLVLHNIRSPLRRKLIFLGDAGSMLLGFMLAWSAIRFAENPEPSIYPVSIVWVFGLVVLDTVATVVRRVFQGRNPLAPGRDHLHHLLLGLGYSPQKVVWMMYGGTAATAAVGLAGWGLEVPEAWLTFSFIALSGVYYFAVAHAWRLAKELPQRPAVSIAALLPAPKKRILFLTDNFPPETNAPASRTFEHARQWVRAGHPVTVITCAPNFPQGKVHPGYRNAWRMVELMDGIRVVRVKTYISANSGFLRRTLDYMSFMVSAAVFGLAEKPPSVVIGTSPQLFTVVAAWFLAAVRQVPFVFELRDLWPESIESVGAAKRGRLMALLAALVNWLYRSADLIVSVTESFKTELASRGIDPEKLVVVRNGVDLSRFSARRRDELLAKKWGVEGKFVLGYFGTHGMAHGLDNVLGAAERLQHRDDIAFVFLGDGAEKARLVATAAEKGLSNVVFVNSVSKDMMPAAWSVCDVALVHLKNDPLFSKVIPSKIFEASGAGRAMLLVLPQGEAASLVEQYSMGEWIPAGEPAALADRAAALADDRDRVAAYAHNAAAASIHFSREALARTMLAEIESLAGTQIVLPAVTAMAATSSHSIPGRSGRRSATLGKHPRLATLRARKPSRAVGVEQREP